METLHILNGDATLYVFEQTGIDGDTMIWREVLSEGPVEENIGSAGFWKNRAAWIGTAFNESEDGYQQKMLDQLAMLSEPYDEINLWFEFDLHCQINMIGAMTYLDLRTDLSHPSVFLICPAEFPGKPGFKGMGELKEEELEYLYDNIRIQLSREDFIIANEAWNLYVSKDPVRLQQYLDTNTFWGSLHQLKPALQAELKRLQLNETGLNVIEQTLLDIYNSGITTREAIHKEFWKLDKTYGMGDLEIDIYLGRLREKQLIE